LLKRGIWIKRGSIGLDCRFQRVVLCRALSCIQGRLADIRQARYDQKEDQDEQEFEQQRGGVGGGGGLDANVTTFAIRSGPNMDNVREGVIHNYGETTAEHGLPGLPAERILLGARIVAAADVFDALTAPRYYKPAYTLEKTLEIMDGMAGDHLDPAVVAAVRRNVHDLEWTLDSMKHTWPKPGDEGMSKSPESGLSERDRARPSS